MGRLWGALAGVAGLILAAPAVAETAPCAALWASVAAMTGVLTKQAPLPQDGWCSLDGAVLQLGEAEVVAESLRLRGEAAGAVLTEVQLDAQGLRLRPGLGDELDPTWRETFRLQTADVALTLVADPSGLALRDAVVRLSGGTEVQLEADVAGAALAPAALALGRLTRLSLDWRNDGKLLRPALEAAGEALEPGATGPKAVDAARAAMRGVVAALPGAMVGEADRKELDQLIDALPQGRGRLVLELRSEAGMGAAQLAAAALSDDPTGPETLARLLAGVALVVDWTPGLAE